MTDIATLSCSCFTALVDATVSLQSADGQTVSLTLASATEHPKATPPDAKRTAFALVFKTPQASAIDEGAFTLTHPELGAIGPVFIERIHSGQLAQDEATYQAVFN